MDLAAFEEKARAYFEEIPPEFRERVQGPVVVAGKKGAKNVRGMLTLGECVHAPRWHGDEPLLSTVFLYYGSFRDVAARDPDFDVDAELRETVRHEVQHHIEDMAGVSRLRDYDWAAAENAKRAGGFEHAPNFWRACEPLKDDPALRMIDGDLFLEVELPRGEWDDARRDGLVVTVAGEELEIPAGEIELDEEQFDFDGPFDVESQFHHEPANGDLTVIVRRKRTLLPGAGRRP
jgi:predicted Zn-dependent protease with MMP-like domain